jgi:hypothetical protein
MLSPVLSSAKGTCVPMCLNVRRLSPISNPPEGRIVIVLKAFYDHGNDINSELYDIVTLAGYSAREKDWPAFENRWKTRVARAWADCRNMPDVQPYIHVAEMMVGRCPFSRDQGWTDARIQSLLSDCSLHIAEATATKLFRGVACSVLLKDYKKIRREGIAVASVEDICSSFCVARAVAWNADFAEDFMREGAELYFDQNGPFRGSIANRKKHGKLRRNEAWKKLGAVGEVDSTVVPAVQAADLLAWSVDSYQEGKRPSGTWQLAMVSIERENLFLGEHALRNPNRDELERLLGLNLARGKRRMIK